MLIFWFVILLIQEGKFEKFIQSIIYLFYSSSKSLQFGELKIRGQRQLKPLQIPQNPSPSFLKKLPNKVIKLLSLPLLYFPLFLTSKQAIRYCQCLRALALGCKNPVAILPSTPLISFHIRVCKPRIFCILATVRLHICVHEDGKKIYFFNLKHCLSSSLQTPFFFFFLFSFFSSLSLTLSPFFLSR